MTGRTRLVRADVFPCYGLLLVYLILKMDLPLLEHLQVGSKRDDGIFGGGLALFVIAAGDPAEHAGHDGFGSRSEEDGRLDDVSTIGVEGCGMCGVDGRSGADESE